ncbi:MAG: 16S rRNA (uracil(1498)-N(3))-methyltransferase [Cyanobacteria bacterium]|nr:16S rRNA (uracil(1498)-N(3))-methyltransferase [Cyanobacteriota bacterium]
MARELRRLLIPPGRLQAAAARIGLDQAGWLVELESEEAHYVARVLRFRHGDRLALINGEGQLWTATLEQQAVLKLEQPLDQPLERASRPRPTITLAMAVPKRDAELVWRMATELGASQLQPLLASRGVVRGDLPLERWRTIVREATEQCERLWLPQLAEPVEVVSWFSTPAPGASLLATTRQEALPTLAELLPSLLQKRLTNRPDQSPPELRLAIGPEGGWSADEEAAALAAGWQPVSLGSAILRTSTAAVAALAWLALGSERQG